MTDSKPSNTDYERAVLACIIRGDDDTLEIVRERLRENDFGDYRHQAIYAAMLRLVDGITEDSVCNELDRVGQLDMAGGGAYVASLDLDLPDLGRIETYVELVKERSVHRRLKAAAEGISEDCAGNTKLSAADLMVLIDTALGSLRISDRGMHWKYTEGARDKAAQRAIRLLESVDAPGVGKSP